MPIMGTVAVAICLHFAVQLLAHMLQEQYGLLEQDPCAVLGSTELVTSALLEAGYKDIQVG
jgi:hypothetical protein